MLRLVGIGRLPGTPVHRFYLFDVLLLIVLLLFLEAAITSSILIYDIKSS